MDGPFPMYESKGTLKKNQISNEITSLVLRGVKHMPPLTKLNIMREASTWMNHKEAWMSQRRGLNPERITSFVLRSIQHMPPLMKLNVMEKLLPR